MKRIFYYLLASAVLTATAISCNKEKVQDEDVLPAQDEFVFTATTGELTKTTVEDGEGNEKIVKWAVGDEISVYWNGGSTTATAASADVTTTFTPAATPGEADFYYAAYPSGVASAFADGALTVTVPASQTGAFAAANIAVAKTTDADLDFQFANITALVKFSVSGSTYTKAVFRGGKGETLAGTVPVDMSGAPALGEVTSPAKEIEVTLSGAGDYYISVLPCTLEGGFSVSLYEGENTAPAAYLPVEVELARGTITTLGAIDNKSISNYFVTPAGAGKKNGKNWENALGTAELRGLIKQVEGAAEYQASVLDGVTFHMAKGDYYIAEGETDKRVKIEFNGYDHQVSMTFLGGYPDNLTGTTTAGRDTTVAAGYITAFTGNNEAKIFILGNQTKVEFEGITFKDASLSANGGALEAAAGSTGTCTLELSSCRFINNKNTNSYTGAGIYISKANFRIYHSYFGKNSARNGSAINLNTGEGTIYIANCDFKGNSTSNTSGALQNGGKEAEVVSCRFNKNSAGSYGGGAFHTNGTGAKTTFDGCTFANNTAPVGGAISIQTAEAIFTNCEFTGNSATAGSKKNAGDNDSDVLGSHAGGAIILHNANSVCTLNNCTFTSNTAPNGNGGAIAYEAVAATLNINAGTTFTDCSAYNLGGAIFVSKNGKLTITGTQYDDSKVTFTSCKTLATGNQHGNGGAIWLGEGSTTSISYAVFSNNEAGQESGSTVNYSNGGAIRMLAVSSFSASNCEFTGNRGRNGMCLSFDLGSKKATFTDCNFHDNIGRSGASKDGNAGNFHGGVAQLGSGTIEFTRCAFTDNVAYHGSGAVHMNGANTTSKFTDCSFTRNSVLGGEAGCIQVESTGLAQLDGCTFTNNSIVSGSTVRNGGVFYLKVAGSNLKATGCTFTGNKITGSGNAYGGVVRAQDNSDIQFDDCIFDGNGNVGSGGTIYSGGCIALNANALLKVNNCLFKNNVAKTRGAAIQGGTNVIVYMNNVAFYNNTTTASGGWGVNTHFGNANACMNNVTSIGNHCTNASPGNCASFNGDGGWLVVNSTIIDGTPTAVVRRGGNARNSIFCNNVLINTSTANNVWNMNSTTNFSSAGHNVLSTSGTYNNAAPDASDLLSQTSLPSGAYSEQWNATPHYAVYTWTNSLTGFTPAVQSDVTGAIEAYTETDTVHTGITSIGADFKTWLESLDPDGYTVDGRGTARTGTWWPGAYQQN